MEIQTELLKSQTTESLKALLDYSTSYKDSFERNMKEYFPSDSAQYKGSFEMYEAYCKIVRTLEDELGKRLEDIFIF